MSEMVKLVICYTEGDGCTYHCNETVPVEYEEHLFSVEFEQALLSKLNQNRKARKIQDAYETTKPDYNPCKMTTADEEALSAWFDARPKDKPIYNFYFAGHMWPLEAFVFNRDELDKEHPRLVQPEVYTLEEWFEKKKQTA